MTTNKILEKFSAIRTWMSNGNRAPHKPLLILYAISQLRSGLAQISYEESAEQLKVLLATFGSPKNTRPQYPFVRLCNDGIWQLDSKIKINTTQDYSESRLIDSATKGSFSPEIQHALTDLNISNAVVKYLLDTNFPETLHEDLLAYLNIDLERSYAIIKRRRRDPDFRSKVIEAYGYSCAVCGFHVRKEHQLVAVEAAHIKWHQAGGPDIEANGVALCSMHHKLYDFGLFAINDALIVKVSSLANGNFGLTEWLLNYHNREIRKPHSLAKYPEPEFLIWQVNEVFKGGYRE